MSATSHVRFRCRGSEEKCLEWQCSFQHCWCRAYWMNEDWVGSVGMWSHVHPPSWLLSSPITFSCNQIRLHLFLSFIFVWITLVIQNCVQLFLHNNVIINMVNFNWNCWCKYKSTFQLKSYKSLCTKSYIQFCAPSIFLFILYEALFSSVFST